MCSHCSYKILGDDYHQLDCIYGAGLGELESHSIGYRVITYPTAAKAGLGGLYCIECDYK